MNKKKQMKFLYLAAFVCPLLLDVLIGKYVHIGAISTIAGLFWVSILIFYSSFRQHKHGIFSQWSDPNFFIKMKINDGEKNAAEIGLCLSAGGLLSVVIRVLIF